MSIVYWPESAIGGDSKKLNVRHKHTAPKVIISVFTCIFADCSLKPYIMRYVIKPIVTRKADKIPFIY